MKTIAIRKSEMERAGSRIRTDDLLITNQLLYQLSYAGENAAQTNARCRLKQVAVPHHLSSSRGAERNPGRFNCFDLLKKYC